jgi:hypothetical protein
MIWLGQSEEDLLSWVPSQDGGEMRGNVDSWVRLRDSWVLHDTKYGKDGNVMRKVYGPVESLEKWQENHDTDEKKGMVLNFLCLIFASSRVEGPSGDCSRTAQ